MDNQLAEQGKDVVEALGGWQRYTIVAVCMVTVTVFAIWSMANIAEQSLRLVNAAMAQCGSDG